MANYTKTITNIRTLSFNSMYELNTFLDKFEQYLDSYSIVSGGNPNEFKLRTVTTKQVEVKDVWSSGL